VYCFFGLRREWGLVIGYWLLGKAGNGDWLLVIGYWEKQGMGIGYWEKQGMVIGYWSAFSGIRPESSKIIPSIPSILFILSKGYTNFKSIRVIRAIRGKICSFQGEGDAHKYINNSIFRKREGRP
jgi:hypothetical protein